MHACNPARNANTITPFFCFADKLKGSVQGIHSLSGVQLLFGLDLGLCLHQPRRQHHYTTPTSFKIRTFMFQLSINYYCNVSLNGTVVVFSIYVAGLPRISQSLSQSVTPVWV